MISRITIAFILALLLPNSGLYSQWSTDPTINNPVCTQVNEQADPTIIHDGNGGAIITWYDDRDGNNNIYAQRTNAGGAVLWTLNGLAVCSQASEQTFPSITSDGNGGAIITWHDNRNDDGDIYAQRIDASGSVVWTSDGVAVCTDAGAQYRPAITVDGSGGAVITWYDYRNHTDDNIYVQRIDANGTSVWATDGVVICSQANNQRYATITSDGSGGAIVSWQDERIGSGDPNVYAQRIQSNGTPLWTTDGVAVCVQANFQQEPDIAGDGNSGAIITWQDNRNGNSDIYAQRIDANGAIVWTGTPHGAAVCTLAGTQINPAITDDGSGGAIITWTDSRNMINSSVDIFAQKISSAGAVGWASDIEISTNSQQQNYPAITTNGSGGAIITWYDYRNTNNDIFATRVLSDGSLPVELSALTAEQGNGTSVDVRWTTATETNNHGFEIERKAIDNGNLTMDNWSKAGFVEGSGTANAPREYSFNDRNITAGKYNYRLKQIDRDGSFAYSDEVEVTVGALPMQFSLEQNYPNPFNPTTVFSYHLTALSQTTFIIFDAIGREVAVLVNEVKGAGYYSTQFDGTHLSSGIYFARLTSNGKTQMRKLMLIK